MEHVMAGRDAEFVPLLTLTEAPRAEAPISDAEAAALVVYCLEQGREWWAEHGMDWIEEGVRSSSILEALVSASRDARLGQGSRHRAQRLRRAVAAEPQA
jgi:N-glycosylase/DNA lyase